jgi:ubiquinone/menaquinone biosynthesis C-methylase UbiE
MNVFLRDILVCPQCKSALAELFCKSCHKQYSCENQIPEFLEPDASHASFPFERMSHIRRMELSHFWFQGRRAVILKLLEKFTKRSTKILDVGCGTGFLCEILREKFDTVVGVDQYVEGFTKTPLIRGNATELPIRDSAFDLVLLLDVLEHVDDERVLSEVRRVLTPGGLCVISVPAHPFLWSERDVASGHLRR